MQLIQSGFIQFRINGIRVTSEACNIMKAVRNYYLGIKLYFDLPRNKCRIWIADRKRIGMKQNENILIRKSDDGKSLYVSGEAFWNNIKEGNVLKTRRVGR